MPFIVERRARATTRALAGALIAGAALGAAAGSAGAQTYGFATLQPGRPRAQNLDELPAEARAAAGRRDHERAVQVESRRFVGHALDRARGEHDALGVDVVNERCEHLAGPAHAPVRHVI